MKKKITAALLLAAVMSLSACGSAAQTDSGSADKPEETKKAVTEAAEEKETEKVTEAKAEEAEETEATATEAPEPAADPKFEYYDKLSADHKNVGRKTVYGNSGVGACKENNIVYFQYLNDGNLKLASFNTETKEIKSDLSVSDIPDGEFDYRWVGSWNDYVRLDVHMTLIDGTVKSVPFSDLGHSDYYGVGMFCGNNRISVGCVLGNDYYVAKMYGDLECDFYPYPTYEVELEHGLTETKQENQINDAFLHNDTIYAVGNSGRVYSLNEGTGEWTEADFGFNVYGPTVWNDLLINGYGEIYDLKNGETIAKILGNSKDFYNSYVGGNCNMVLKNGTWYKVQYPSDGSEPDFSKAEALGTESKSMDNIGCIDETYYIVADSYGVFLRTYEKGEAEEETIMMFNS